MIADSINKNFSEYDRENRKHTNLVRTKLLLYTDHEITKYNKNSNILFNHELPKNIIKRYENEMTVSFVNPTVNSLESKFRGENQIFKDNNSPFNSNSKEMDQKSIGREIFSKCIKENGKEFIDKRKKNVGVQKMNKSDHRFLKKNDIDLIGNFSENFNNKKGVYNNKYSQKSEKINILKNEIILNKDQKEVIYIKKYHEKLQNLVTQINKSVLERNKKIKTMGKINSDLQIINLIKCEINNPVKSKSNNFDSIYSNKLKSQLIKPNNNQNKLIEKNSEEINKNEIFDRYIDVNNLIYELNSKNISKKSTFGVDSKIKNYNGTNNLINEFSFKKKSQEKLLKEKSKYFTKNGNYENFKNHSFLNKNLNLEVIENEENYDTYSSSDSSYNTGNEMKLVIVEKNEKSQKENDPYLNFSSNNKTNDLISDNEKLISSSTLGLNKPIINLKKCPRKISDNEKLISSSTLGLNEPIINLKRCQKKFSSRKSILIYNNSDISLSKFSQSENENCLGLITSNNSGSVMSYVSENSISENYLSYNTRKEL